MPRITGVQHMASGRSHSADQADGDGRVEGAGRVDAAGRDHAKGAEDGANERRVVDGHAVGRAQRAGWTRRPAGFAVLGIGTDLVDIDRLRGVLARSPRVRDRLFTAGEQAYAEGSADPARPYAARFAAKEAVLKSLGLGLGGMRFAEIDVVRRESGRPELVLSGAAAQLALDHGASGFLVSLSHTGTLASAFVVAVAG